MSTKHTMNLCICLLHMSVLHGSGSLARRSSDRSLGLQIAPRATCIAPQYILAPPMQGPCLEGPAAGIGSRARAGGHRLTRMNLIARLFTGNGVQTTPDP